MTRIRTPFGPDSTAAEVLQGVGLEGRRAIVTGGASGIGKETARALAAAGAEVTLAVRDLDAGQRAAAEISPERARKGRRALSRFSRTPPRSPPSAASGGALSTSSSTTPG